MARQKSTIGHNPLAAMTADSAAEVASHDDAPASATSDTVRAMEAVTTAEPVPEAQAVADTPPAETEVVAAEVTAEPAAASADMEAAAPISVETEDTAGATAGSEPHLHPTEAASPLDIEPETVLAEAMAEPDDFVPDETAPAAGSATPGANPSRRGAGIRIVRRYMAWSGAAGLLPLPAVDVASAAAVQVKMLHSLSFLYGVPFNAALARQLIMALLGGGGSVMLALPAASAAKTVPVVGPVASLLLSPALTTLSCYVIGRAFLGHFEAGGTLETFDVSAIKAAAATNGRTPANTP